VGLNIHSPLCLDGAVFRELFIGTLHFNSIQTSSEAHPSASASSGVKALEDERVHSLPHSAVTVTPLLHT
jgi:hypothetical protein